MTHARPMPLQYDGVKGILDANGEIVLTVKHPLMDDLANEVVLAVNTLDEAKAVLEKYTHYGQLQSFESREQFRTEAGAVLAKLEGGAR